LDSAVGGTLDGAVLALRLGGAPPAADLILGGEFLTIGGVAASHVARYDGVSFAPLGPGLNGAVRALELFNGEPVAAGAFTSDGSTALTRAARWTGAAWASMGSGLNADAFALLSADLGGGASLYATGQFTTAGGLAAVGAARWDGSAWSALGGGLVGDAKVGLALASHDDGRGPALFVGGSFLGAGSTPSANIVRWDGLAWSAVGAGLNGPVRALTEFNGRLIAGGDFTAANGVGGAARLAVWDGSAWAEFAGGANGPVRALTVITPVGGAPILVAGGEFTVIGGVAAVRVAMYDGVVWSPLDAGSASIVRALARRDDDLYLGANATTPVGSSAPALLRWTLCVSGLPGDLNNDGMVNGADISVILSNWGQTGVLGDLNNDGAINGADISVILSNFTG